MVSRPGREESWSPSVVGLSKRDLLRDVLSIFGKGAVFCVDAIDFCSAVRSKTLTKLAMDWQDTLKKAMNED